MLISMHESPSQAVPGIRGIFFEDLPHGEDLIQCRVAVNEASMITSHKLIYFVGKTTENDL